jgi:hypothetical protein
VITAGFDSRCPGCGEQIGEGDPIGLVDGDWCCGGCVDEHGEDLWEGEQ